MLSYRIAALPSKTITARRLELDFFLQRIYRLRLTSVVLSSSLLYILRKKKKVKYKKRFEGKRRAKGREHIIEEGNSRRGYKKIYTYTIEVRERNKTDKVSMSVNRKKTSSERIRLYIKHK